jgi:hypothetical protein
MKTNFRHFLRVRHFRFYLGAIFGLSQLTQAALPPIPVPTDHNSIFSNDGVFEGGRFVRAALKSMTVGTDRHDKVERWSFDFQKVSRGGTLPRYQIRSVTGVASNDEDDSPSQEAPRLILTFQQLTQNNVGLGDVRRCLAKSRWVSDVLVYPSVDNGDTAIEMILKRGVKFSLRQLTGPSAQLIIDLKHS